MSSSITYFSGIGIAHNLFCLFRETWKSWGSSEFQEPRRRSSPQQELSSRLTLESLQAFEHPQIQDIQSFQAPRHRFAADLQQIWKFFDL